MTMPLVHLVMIVKNEAPSIKRVLDSVRGAVDSVTICDTGSEDGTQAKVREWCFEQQMPHVLVEKPFVAFDKITDRRIIDFAATRNMALDIDAARDNPPVFTLMMSGDETLVGGMQLRAFLEAHRDAPDDAYAVLMQRDAKAWKYPRILRTNGGRRYVFPIHETPVGKDGNVEAPLIPDVRITYAPPDDVRLLQRMREVDIPVLTVMAETKPETHEDHVSRARALMFLGQTHENLALEFDKDDLSNARITHLMSAMSFYFRRAALEGDADDANYAMFHFLDIAEKIDLYTHEEMMTRLEVLSEADPRRPEVRYKLAFHASQVDARKAAFFGEQAVRVAREAKANPPTFSTDSRMEWLSLQIVAEAAKILKYPERARKAAEDGLAAGGPAGAFSEYLAP
jgi:glycosyltransferase involved in cell wall biosynthesis